MTKIADDVNSIAARLKEIQEEKLQAIMGQPLEHKSAFDEVAEPVEAPKDIDWTGMYGYPCGYSITVSPSALNEQARRYIAAHGLARI